MTARQATHAATEESAVPAGSLAPRNMDDEVARLHHALGRVSRMLREGASGGLTPTQLAVLGALLRDGPRQLTELAAAERINPTLLSRVIGRLEEGGLVSRSTQAQDRRSSVVAITEQGSALVATLRRERCQELGAVVAELDPAHVAALFAALPALEALASELLHHRKD